MAYTTIDKPTDYFNTKLYTGTGSAQNITGIGFQPDFIWGKTRADNGSSSQTNHILTDSVRGAGKNLFSDRNVSERTNSARHSGFLSDGFSVGDDGQVNTNTNTYVAWNWLAGGSASSNSDGSITSSVSANTTAGFSIVSFTGNATTGATIGHGLGVTPDVIIAKSRASDDNWGFFHSSFSSQEYMFLNTTSAKASASSVWNALPSSSVFTVGDNASVNDNGNMIAYCFAEKKGYSKFGSYTGNGNADGTFVYTGFKPAMLIMKASSGTSNWTILDNKRDPHNVTTNRLQPNLSNAEDTPVPVDFLSNGFKHRSTNLNSSGDTHIYMVFAESPFVTSSGIPTTAR